MRKFELDPLDDDQPVGRVLTRREVLKLLGGTGVAVVAVGAGVTRFAFAQEATAEATAAVPACVVRPEMTEGPYFVDEMLSRSDIRVEPSDGSIKEGVLVHLIFNVTDVTDGSCVPLEGVQVDVWHCDALGTYSGVEDASFSTLGEKWLRGYQVTDENGKVEFTTIYPGWYSGRAVHIHFKIRTDPDSESGYEFTSQLFLDDTLSDSIFELEPYSQHEGPRDTYNDTDMHYANGGDQLLVEAFEADDGSYTISFEIGLDLNDEEVGASDSFSTGGGGSMGGGPGGEPPSDPSATAESSG